MSVILAETAKDFTLEKLFRLVDGVAYLKSYEKPYLIIKYGPPGSGKTSADERIETQLGISLRNFARIDKDNPLIVINEFRKGSMDIVKRYSGVAYRSQAVQKKVLALQERILSEKNQDGLSILDKIPIALQRAFDYKLNVLWETTGQSAGSQKLLDLVFDTVPKSYRIIVVFPIVSLQTAKKRVIGRAEMHLLENPPYYRPVPVSHVKKATTLSHTYFKEVIVPKVLNGKITQLFCYNNNSHNRNNTHAKEAPSKRRTRKRIAPGWVFGLNKTKQRKITKDIRVKEKA